MDDELREILRRADRHPDRQCALTIKDRFFDFPDLKGKAINTIYGLCEDPDQNIRICGYGAITSISKVDRLWLVRNADVLVQLLQSDDEQEVTVVKKALQEHINLDPAGTLRVVCDQCAVDDDISVSNSAMEVEDEEAILRRRLRSLVLRFLEEKYDICISRVVRNEEAEEILFNGLLKAIQQSTLSELQLIVKDILIILPSLSTRADRNNALLDALLQRAASSFQTEMGIATSSTRSSLQMTLPILELTLVTIVALPCSSPATRKQQVTVARAYPERMSRIFFASSDVHLPLASCRDNLVAEQRLALVVARTWEACNEELQLIKDEARKRQVIQLRREVAKEAGYLLNVLSRTKKLDFFQALFAVLKAVQSHTSASRNPASQSLLQALATPLKSSITAVSVVPFAMLGGSDRETTGHGQADEPLFDNKADINSVRMEVGQLYSDSGGRNKFSAKDSIADINFEREDGRNQQYKNERHFHSEGDRYYQSQPSNKHPCISTSSGIGKRKLEDADRHVILAQRLGAASPSFSSVSVQGGNTGTAASVSIFGAASRPRVTSAQNTAPSLVGINVRSTRDQLQARFERFGGGSVSASPSPAPNTGAAMDVEFELLPRSAKRARSAHHSSSGSANQPSPADLLSRLSTGPSTQPLRMPSPRSSSSPIPLPQGTSMRMGPTSTPSLLSRMRTGSGVASGSPSNVAGQGIRLRCAASESSPSTLLAVV